MARPIDYPTCMRILTEAFEEAEADFAAGTAPTTPPEIIVAVDRLMQSRTQAYREILISCALARLYDDQIDLSLPYVNQGDTAYNARTLTEEVVTPFLHEHEVPSSKGPFLNVFRRSVTFKPETRAGLRDKNGYDAFLLFIDQLQQSQEREVKALLRYLLYAFVRMRDASVIPLAQIQKLSLEQYEIVIGNLLQTPSGGRFPVLLAVAMFQTIAGCFHLDWQIDWQGINVADRASDVGGDITIKSGGDVVLSVEVTERLIEAARVRSTFSTKILRHGISDYLFFFSSVPPAADARELARNYLGQGHDISFLPVKEWLINSLGTIGPRCRAMFTTNFLALLGSLDVPAALKLAWNTQIQRLVEGAP
jgi:hypothetical protein